MHLSTSGTPPRCAERACPGHDRRPQRRALHLPLLGAPCGQQGGARNARQDLCRRNQQDPSRLPPPESVTDAFLALAFAECTRNGEVVMAPALSLRPNE